jgi:sulfite exporter TauE/SafE
MKQNIGNTDKIIRIILGIIIAALGFYYKSWWGLIALVPFLTAIISYCPLYPIFGINTKKTKE